MFKYINIKTNEVICLKDELYWLGYDFHYKGKFYEIVNKKYVNGELVIYCQEFVEEP